MIPPLVMTLTLTVSLTLVVGVVSHGDEWLMTFKYGSSTLIKNFLAQLLLRAGSPLFCNHIFLHCLMIN